MSKWKCISRPDGESRNFTVGKVYELDDVTDELTGDSGYRYGTKHVNADCGGTIAFLQGCKIMFEEVTSMFGKSDLKTGMFVQTRNEEKWMVMRDSIYGNILVSMEEDKFARSHSYVSIDSYNEDLTRRGNENWDIMMVTVPCIYPDVFDAKSEITRAMVVYERKEPKEPKELTVKQIEELLWLCCEGREGGLVTMEIDKELLDRFEQDYLEIWNLATKATECNGKDCINGKEFCAFSTPEVGCKLYELRSCCRMAINFLREAAKKQEVKEMSVAEIEKILGYPIKVVKE